MRVELKQLTERGTWELSEKPRDRKLLRAKWCYDVKTDEQGNIEKLKARLVAKGYTQRKGEDYEETYAGVTRAEVVRIILTIAARKDNIIKQYDVKGAYLYPEVDKELYMEMPEGYQQLTGQDCKPGTVLLLRKGLYGLKQAGRLWDKDKKKTLMDNGYRSLISDPGTYVRTTKDGRRTIAITWVDDFIVIAKDESGIENFEKAMRKYELVERKKANWYLKLEIKRDRGRKQLSINQRQYIEEILKDFNMQDCHPVKNPMELGWTKTEEDRPQEMTRYRELVGKLTYLAMWSRPDIAFATNKLARANNNPTAAHYQALKRILRYLKGTMDVELIVGGSEPCRIEVYVDADLAGDVDTRKSTSGVIVRLGNSTVCWNSKLQKSVALSTMEAEYMATALGTQQAIWIKAFLKEIDEDITETVIRVDNQAAIDLANDPKHHNRSKHIDIRYHFIREQMELGTIQIKKVHTSENFADIMTKALPAPSHLKHVECIFNYSMIQGER